MFNASGFVRSCAAEADGRRRRGVTVPLATWARDEMSSPSAEGPAEEKNEPFADLLSVEELPERVRAFMYFSRASASRSRIRFATGDSAVEDEWRGEEAPRIIEEDEPLVLLADGPWGDRNECGTADGDDDDDWLRCAGAKPLLSSSPLSDVVVVRLVPDPLLNRFGGCLNSRAFDGTGGGRLAWVAPHSLPLTAAC
jgi:hypothetical protein